MTDPNLTHIAVVLDKSSSMESVRGATISGFNEFLDTQRKTPGAALLDLLQFSDRSEWVYRAAAVQGVAPLTLSTYAPMGGTALLDAIGDAVDALGKSLADKPEAERPSKVVVVVMTDGEENASKRFDRERVRAMIAHQSTNYNWQFIFMGANQDAILAASYLGIRSANSVTYAATTSGTLRSMNLASAKVSSYRASGNSADLGYSATDRAEALGDTNG